MIIDGLQCGHFDRNAFQSLQTAGMGGVVVTRGFRGGTVGSPDSLARWRDLVRENSDIAGIAATASAVMHRGRWTRGVGYGAGSEEEIAKITHGNWLRPYETTFGNPREEN